MSDIKNPAPFYSLKEASKELNRLLKVDYYDSKKLLSMALVYDLKLYIFAKGWEGVAYYSEDMTPEYDERTDVDKFGGYTDIHLRHDETIETIVNAILNSFLSKGCLLQIPLEAIKILTLEKKCNFDSNISNFLNLLDIADSFTANPPNYFLELFKRESPYPPIINHLYHSKIDIDVVKSLVDIMIYGIQLKSISQYMTLNDFVEPKETAHITIDGNSTDLLLQIINRTDILITHYQLSRIIDGVLVIREKEQSTFEDLITQQTSKKPQGKSQAKIEAQVAARAIALHLWKNDKERKIKIGSMCQQVWNTLCETEHREQLPDKVESLKDWIRDIAPAYAKLGGRQKEY
ncbi:hypothetical protein [Acinetobacter sp. BSP-53]|uniref:hypothetical protein n=1 Tax=Acinetobacter sp. BSP-53 TaxID=3344662 RepID=UPI00376F9919